MKYYTNRFGPCLEKPFTPLSSLFLLFSVSPLVDGRLVVLFPGWGSHIILPSRKERKQFRREERILFFLGFPVGPRSAKFAVLWHSYNMVQHSD